jgi:hypothetical protein
MPSLGPYLKSNPTNNGVNLQSYAHASRLYADNVFALAPKAGWLYYVVFDVNPNAVIDKTWFNRQHVAEVGMLVKNADLPKFQITTEVLNQYNRKTIVQKNIAYQPVNLTLHDDNSNVTHNLWLNYFRYYFVDSTLSGTGPNGTAKDNNVGAYSNNKYLPSTNIFTPTNYGLNSSLVVDPFFRSITLYQLNKQVFTSFQLINPIVKSWDHDRLDQTQGNKVAESKMSVEYETVFYGSGQVKKDDPTGFAVFHYDNTPSPLGNPNLSSANVYGDVTGDSNPNGKPSAIDHLNSLLTPNYSLPRGTSVSSPSATGQITATPISLVSISAPTTLTQTPAPLGVVPTSSESIDAGTKELSQLSQLTSAVDSAQFTISTNDTTPSGNTVSPGNYFPIPQPLEDSSLYTNSSIDQTSSVSEIQSALSHLNTSWANDNDFVGTQVVSPDVIANRLNNATSSEEFSAIQQAAQLSLTLTQNLQQTVNNKYQAEYSRLTSLLNSAQTNTLGSNTQSLHQKLVDLSVVINSLESQLDAISRNFVPTSSAASDPSYLNVLNQLKAQVNSYTQTMNVYNESVQPDIPLSISTNFVVVPANVSIYGL